MKRGIYFASRPAHAKQWGLLRYDGILVSSTWIDKPVPCADPRQLWAWCEIDIRRSASLIIYAEEGERLRGAIFEAGMALAFGVPVFAVGPNECFGDWINHERVTRCPDVRHAVMIAPQERE